MTNCLHGPVPASTPEFPPFAEKLVSALGAEGERGWDGEKAPVVCLLPVISRLSRAYNLRAFKCKKKTLGKRLDPCCTAVVFEFESYSNDVKRGDEK